MTRTRLMTGCAVATALLAGVGCVDELDIETARSEIRDGTEVAEGDWEAVVKVLVNGEVCTGTLFDDTHVITAAHCICAEAVGCTSPIHGQVIFTNVLRADGTRGDAEIELGGLAMHPDFEMGGVYASNDIAVLELSVAASLKVQVAPLALGALPRPGTPVTVVGWGQSGRDCLGDADAKRWRTTTVDSVVSSAWGDVSLHLEDSVGCSGDSGGPVFGPNDEILGVFSTGDVAKAVRAYLPWIAMQTTSPGNRVATFDLACEKSQGRSLFRDWWADPKSLHGWLDSGDAQLVGNFTGLTTWEQILYVNRGPGLPLAMASYATASGPAYWYPNVGGLANFIQPNDKLLVGDFAGIGHDQLLMLNQSGAGEQIRIVDLGGIQPNPEPWYVSTYASEPLVGWHDPDDAILVGDFRGLGHDQLMFINRAGSQGRIAIVDFSDPNPPGEWVYVESYDSSALLNGWHDADDVLVAGDFRGFGHDQVMFINNAGFHGRVLIADFHDGVAPAEIDYWEPWGGSSILDGFHEHAVDVVLAGTFTGQAHDVVAFVNRDAPWFNRVLVADFSDGLAPAEARFIQTQAQAAPILPRIDAGDLILAGTLAPRLVPLPFEGCPGGYDRLITIERTSF